MKNLIIKELKLIIHPATYLWLLISAMVLIPTYPYEVVFVYAIGMLAPCFAAVGANKDQTFTMALPVDRKDYVKSKFFDIFYIELLFTACVAVMTGVQIGIYGNVPNYIGMSANLTMFGFAFIVYGLFNAVFMPCFFKTGIKIAKGLIFSGLAVILLYTATELMLAFIPQLKFIFALKEGEYLWCRGLFLLFGVIFYASTAVVAYFRSVKLYKRVNI